MKRHGLFHPNMKKLFLHISCKFELKFQLKITRFKIILYVIQKKKKVFEVIYLAFIVNYCSMLSCLLTKYTYVQNILFMVLNSQYRVKL